MRARQWWAALTAVSVVTVTLLGTGYMLNRHDSYNSQNATAVTAPELGVTAFEPVGVSDASALQAELAEQAKAEALGNFAAVIRDATSGQTLFEQQQSELMLPASSTKMLTAVAALLELGPGAQIETRVTQPDSSTLVIHATGDVWLDDAAMTDLAAQIDRATDVAAITNIEIRNEGWSAPEFLSGWEKVDIAAGYIAPMQPAMLYGARQGGTTGDLPRSTTPMADVAKALGAALGLENVNYTVTTEYQAPVAADDSADDSADENVVARWESAALSERVDEMMLESDNVMAEAIGREIDGADPIGRTQAILEEHGLSTAAIHAVDNSGLSTDNRISAEFFADLMDLVVSEESLHNIVLGLPVAGGTGTLATRYSTGPAKGWARAKTGTLTGVSALVGVVPSQEGHLYSFALLANDANILDVRAQIDSIVATLREH